MIRQEGLQPLAPQKRSAWLDLETEAVGLRRMLVGKVGKEVWRHRANELGIEFTDGSRFLLDRVEGGLEFPLQGAEEATG